MAPQAYFRLAAGVTRGLSGSGSVRLFHLEMAGDLVRPREVMLYTGMCN